jgi:hypothetical protein
MLVKKTWTTRKYENSPLGYKDYVTRKYYGYFLFGIIPLYIVNYSTEY